MAGIISLVILLIVIGCGVFQFLKGTFVRALATIIVAICALIVAFGFFEGLSSIIISRADKGIFLKLANIAQPFCFVLLFVIVFAALEAATIYLTRDKVDLGLWPERIGRVVCGMILGFILSGVLVTTLAMAPLPSKYPYERFDSASPKPDSPGKVPLNADGFITGLFKTISNGSLGGKRSFASLHPDYISQLFLNRLNKDVSIVTSNSPAISIPNENAVWPAPDAIKTQIDELNSSGQLSKSPGKPSGSYVPMIVRVGIKKAAVKGESKISAGTFTSSQLRLICKINSELEDPLSGSAINVYPVGHFSSRDRIEVTTEIKLDSNSFGSGTSRDIDFVFCVPSGYTPIMVQLKLNNIAQIRADAILKEASQAPSPATYSSQNPGAGGGNRGGMPDGGNYNNGQGMRGRGGTGRGSGNGSNLNPGGQGDFQGTENLPGNTPQDIAENLVEPIMP